MQQPEIRPAGLDDAEAGAWCHLQCWQEAYADLVEPDKLAERTADLETRIDRWAQAAREGRQRWVAVSPDPSAPVRDRVVGFVAIRPNQDDDAVVPLEVQAIYTRKAWWSTGLGSRLMEVATGNQPASLWVLEGNERAIRFYTRKGFVADGVVAADPFFGVSELRMVRHGMFHG